VIEQLVARESRGKNIRHSNLERTSCANGFSLIISQFIGNFHGNWSYSSTFTCGNIDRSQGKWTIQE